LACGTAGSTVIAVGLKINAFAYAIDKSLLAIEFAFAIFADLAISADLVALTAVSAVSFGVDAIAATIEQTLLA
jgi:hypothetical protein